MLSFRRRWLAAIVALTLSAHIQAQQEPPPPPAGAQRFTDATTELIAAINADDQNAIQQMFSEAMQEFLPPEKSGPFFRGVLSAKGKLQAAGAPEVSGPGAKVRVIAERGDWQFDITLDPSGRIAGLRILPGDDKPGRKAESSPATARDSAAESTYLDLRRSEDRTTQLLAERYLGLVKRQEWIDSTGKSTVIAKYVEHDPDLEWVKLKAVRGRGTERVEKEITVPIAKLSKTCQSRVRQIATLQKKLDELALAANEPDATGETAGREPFSDPGSPMLDERGVEPPPHRERRPRNEAAPAAVSRPAPRAILHQDPSSADFDPDPLGFAEIAAPPGLPGSAGPQPGAPLPSGGSIDRQEWATNYDAFRANFTVAQGERGEPTIDWGELEQLRSIGASVGELQNDPAKGDTHAFADRLGEVHWIATFQKFLPGDHPPPMAFDLPPLPPPLQITFVLDEEHLTPDDWNQISANAGNRLSFTGRLAMAGPTSIEVHVRDPKPASGDPRR